jgi:hypothetical protein
MEETKWQLKNGNSQQKILQQNPTCSPQVTAPAQAVAPHQYYA